MRTREHAKEGEKFHDGCTGTQTCQHDKNVKCERTRSAEDGKECGPAVGCRAQTRNSYARAAKRQPRGPVRPQRDPAEISSENRRRSTLPPAAETRWVALLRPPPGRGRGTKSELRSPGCATGVENNRPALPDVRVRCFTILAELRKAARHVPQNKRKKTTCRMDDVSLLQVKS
jgi:hypothetical protein